jgi:hypothetical protein
MKNFCNKIYFCNLLFQSEQHFYEKRKESRSGPVLVTNGSGCGSGRPKNTGKKTFFFNICSFLQRSVTPQRR